MTLDSLEQSIYGAQPVEVYKFNLDGTLYRYTSSDRSKVVNVGAGNETFTVETIRRGAIRFNAERDSGTVQIMLPRSAALVTAFAASPPQGSGTVGVYRIHQGDSEVIVQFSGLIAGIEFDGAEAILNCVPYRYALARRVPRIVYQTQCNWALYGPGCGVDKDSGSYKMGNTITAISGTAITIDAGHVKANGFYDGGYLEKLDGSKRFYIVTHVGDVVTLQEPTSLLAVNEDVYAYAGCDRTAATCASKFSNLTRFMGFPNIPTVNPYETGMR